MRIETKVIATAVAAVGFLSGPAALADPTYPPAQPSSSPSPTTGSPTPTPTTSSPTPTPTTTSPAPSNGGGGGGGGTVVTPITGGGGGGGTARTPTGGTGGGISLPRTGQDLALIALAGGAALVTGAGVVLAVRRPRVGSAAQQTLDEPPLA